MERGPGVSEAMTAQQMTQRARREAVAAARLAGWALGGVVCGVRDVHQAIVARVFGRRPGPAQPGHETVERVVYTRVRAVGTAVATGAGLVAGSLAQRRRPLSQTPVGRAALASLNGLIGDRLADADDPLAVPMALCVERRAVDRGPAALAAAYPQASRRVVLFAHGLMETERWWYRRDEHGGVDFGSRLRDEFGWTPVYLRYNTGRHISDNGASLDRLLDELVVDWPVPVTDLALVGHSMGGMVCRSAVRQAADRCAAWTGPLRHVVSLGSPNRGADLEKAANIAAWLLRHLPETRPLAALLALRSSGIKDLRYGYLGRADWTDRDPDTLWADHRGDCPDLDDVHYHFVAASLTRDPEHLGATLLGDVLVRGPSAVDRRTEGSLHRLGGMHHWDLLTDEQVYRLLREWLGQPARTDG